MINILLMCSVISCASGTNISKAADAKANQTITITVPPMRILYLDEQNRITSILNNTPDIPDKKLQAFKNGVEVPIGSAIKARYEKLSQIVDWSRIGWVYQWQNHEPQLPETAQRMKKTKDENEISPDGIASADKAGEIIIIYESVSEQKSRTNTFPLPPHKDSHVIRATVYDSEDITKISTEYLPQHLH